MGKKTVFVCQKLVFCPVFGSLTVFGSNFLQTVTPKFMANASPKSVDRHGKNGVTPMNLSVNEGTSFTCGVKHLGPHYSYITQLRLSNSKWKIALITLATLYYSIGQEFTAFKY